MTEEGLGAQVSLGKLGAECGEFAWDSRGAEDAAGESVVLDLLAVDEHHGLRSELILQQEASFYALL